MPAEMSSPRIDDSTGIREFKETENSSAKIDSNTDVLQSVFKKGKDLSETATEISKRSNGKNLTNASEIGDGM